MLRTSDRSIRLVAAPSDSAALTRLGGVEIVARGDEDDGRMRVKSFTAIRVNGQPVLDGVLRFGGGVFVLQTATGPITLGNPPSALREMLGARIWISGPVATGPNSYGVIVPEP